MRMMSNFCNGVKKRRKIALLVQAVGLCKKQYYLKTNTENKEVFCYEDDISAKEEIPCKGSWFPCKNEHKGRKKGSGSKKSKGKKGSLCLIEQYQLS